MNNESSKGPVFDAAFTRFGKPVILKGPQKVSINGCEFSAGLGLSLSTKSQQVEVSVSASVFSPGLEGAPIVLNVPGNTAAMAVSVTGCDIIGAAQGAIGPFSAVNMSGNYWADGLSAGTEKIAGSGKKDFSNASGKPVAQSSIPAVTVATATAFTFEAPDIRVPVPAGWQSGGSGGARKPVPGGSITLMTVTAAGRGVTAENLFEREKNKYMRIDKNHTAAALSGEDAVAPRAGVSQFMIDLVWNESPWRVLYYIAELDKSTGGVVVSLPRNAWEDLLPEIRAILEKTELKMRSGG